MEKIGNIAILEQNQNSSDIIISYIREFGYTGELKSFSDYNEGLEYIKDIPSIVVIADFSDLSESDTNVVEQINNYTNKLIIMSLNCSANAIIRALRAGAKDFLPKPVLKEDLKQAIKTVSAIKDENITNSKIISVYSNKGGIGKTTIAVNLASELARVTGNKVALVDLNLQLGDISTFLNLTPAFDVGYVTRQLVSNNDIPAEKFFEKYKDISLYVLSDPNYIEQSENITPQLIQKLFDRLKKHFSYIIVDLSSTIDQNTLKILDISDFIMFTAIVNIPSIRNAQRCLNLFRSRKYPKNKIKIVVNRYMENDEIKLEDIESTLGEKVYWKIPNNYFTIMETINKGTSIWEINSNSNIGISFRDFATKISDEIIEESVLQYRN